MLRGIYTAASGLINTQLKQDVTANNLANSSTVGFKQDKVVTKPFSELMIQNRDNPESEVQNLGRMPFGVESGEVYTNFKEGDFEVTGKDLDLAIGGKGFLPIKYFDGIRDTIKYSRGGSFHLDSEGMIVNNQGGYLLSKNIDTGQIEPITAGTSKVEIDKEGKVSINGVSKYFLTVNDFEDYNSIIKDGSNNYIVANDYIQPVEVSKESYEINQGILEQSNIDVSSEMVSMITNLRSFQANQRVLASIDETLGKTVNEVGALR